MDRRAVVTGLGAVTCLGLNADELWTHLLEGKCGIDTITAFDPVGFTCKIAGQVPEFRINKNVPKAYRKAVKLMSRDIEISVLAADQAIRSSGFVTKATADDTKNINISPERTAINIGAGLISCDLVELAPAVEKSITEGRFDIRKWGSQGLEALTPIWLLKYLPNMLACHIGIIHDFQGLSNTITCGEASAHLAIAEAALMIGRGDADVALTGGCEAKVNPIVMLRQCLLKRATAENNDSPKTACRPFDANAAGSVFGEGAAMLVLEEYEHALSRNAKILAEIAGSGSSNSINPVYEHLESDGRGITIAIEKALADAEIKPEQIDLIIPHGTGIPQDDLAEAAGIEKALGPAAKDIPVWPTKSMISNTGAGAGAIDALIAAKAIMENTIGPSLNCDEKIKGCNLNINTRKIEKPIQYVLCCSYSFGGQTAAIVIKSMNGKK